MPGWRRQSRPPHLPHRPHRPHRPAGVERPPWWRRPTRFAPPQPAPSARRGAGARPASTRRAAGPRPPAANDPTASSGEHRWRRRRPRAPPPAPAAGPPAARRRRTPSADTVHALRAQPCVERVAHGGRHHEVRRRHLVARPQLQCHVANGVAEIGDVLAECLAEGDLAARQDGVAHHHVGRDAAAAEHLPAGVGAVQLARRHLEPTPAAARLPAPARCRTDDRWRGLPACTSEPWSASAHRRRPAHRGSARCPCRRWCARRSPRGHDPAAPRPRSPRRSPCPRPRAPPPAVRPSVGRCAHRSWPRSRRRARARPRSSCRHRGRGPTPRRPAAAARRDSDAGPARCRARLRRACESTMRASSVTVESPNTFTST